MLTEFFDTASRSAHDRFQQWRTTHQDGTFLTLLSRARARLHGTRCQHLGSGPPYFQLEDGFGSLTAVRKVCATTEDELVSWANENGVEVQPCRHCIRDRLIRSPSVAGEPLRPEGPHSGDLFEQEARRAEESGDFDPASVEDARERTIAAIVRRRGQPAFRSRLLELYGVCALTGCPTQEALEAAHIKPYLGPKTNHPQNGILLRSEVHVLFDIGLISIDPRTMTVQVHPNLQNTEYGRLAGRPVRLPQDAAMQPSRDALAEHQRRCGLTQRLA